MSDPVLDALWNKVVDHWDDDDRHARFLQHCQATEQLAEAAARYASMRDDRDRGQVAKKRLDAVTVLATTSLLSATSTERVPMLPKWFTFVVLFLFSSLAGYVLLRALR